MNKQTKNTNECMIVAWIYKTQCKGGKGPI